MLINRQGQPNDAVVHSYAHACIGALVPLNKKTKDVILEIKCKPKNLQPKE